MSRTRHNIPAMSGVLAICLAYATLGYTTDLVPFPYDKRATISAHDICSPFKGKKTSSTLNQTLPTRSQYSFKYHVDPPRQKGESEWSAYCDVHGEGQLLIRGSTELNNWKNTDNWHKKHLEHIRESEVDEGKIFTFQVGAETLVSGRTAYIMVPCLTPEDVIGESHYQLTVKIHAEESLTSTSQQNRKALVTLATEMAKYTHRRARCTAPSQLPDEGTRISAQPL